MRAFSLRGTSALVLASLAAVPLAGCSGGHQVAASVSVCVPLLASEDGSYYVFEERSRASAEDGRVELELEDGLWALCPDGGGTSASVLVHVDSSRSDAATVGL